MQRKFSDVSASDFNNYNSFAFLRKSWKDRAKWIQKYWIYITILYSLFGEHGE